MLMTTDGHSSLAGKAPGMVEDKNHAGTPLGKGGEQPGDVGKIDLAHPLIPPT